MPVLCVSLQPPASVLISRRLPCPILPLWSRTRLNITLVHLADVECAIVVSVDRTIVTSQHLRACCACLYPGVMICCHVIVASVAELSGSELVHDEDLGMS